MVSLILSIIAGSIRVLTEVQYTIPVRDGNQNADDPGRMRNRDDNAKKRQVLYHEDHEGTLRIMRIKVNCTHMEHTPATRRSSRERVPLRERSQPNLKTEKTRRKIDVKVNSDIMIFVQEES